MPCLCENPLPRLYRAGPLPDGIAPPDLRRNQTGQIDNARAVFTRNGVSRQGRKRQGTAPSLAISIAILRWVPLQVRRFPASGGEAAVNGLSYVRALARARRALAGPMGARCGRPHRGDVRSAVEPPLDPFSTSRPQGLMRLTIPAGGHTVPSSRDGEAGYERVQAPCLAPLSAARRHPRPPRYEHGALSRGRRPAARRGPSVDLDPTGIVTGKSPDRQRRQFLNYSFYRLDPVFRRLPADERRGGGGRVHRTGAEVGVVRTT